MSSPSGGSGLSDGAKAGIGVGVPVAIAAIGAVAYLLFKTGIVGTGAAASGPAWSGVAGGGAPAPAPAPAWSGVTGGESAWNGVTGGEHAWNGVTGSGPPPAVPPTYDAAPIFIAGAVRKNSSSDDSRIPYSPHGAHSGLPSPSPYTPGYQHPPRSISPPDQYPHRQEMRGHPVRYASEMSGDGARSELSAGGAYSGHEIYGTERYEAPAGLEEQRPVYRAYDPRH